jgi:hypothetical protein
MNRLAATIFQLFVASDTASDTLAALKRIHGLMPYFVLKGILRISNPMAMIRGEHSTFFCGSLLDADVVVQACWICSSRDRSAANLSFNGEQRIQYT